MLYAIFFSDNGAPVADLTPTIITYAKLATGDSVSPVPEVTHIAGGGYKFDASPTEALYVEIDGGAALSGNDRYKAMQIGPPDKYLEQIAWVQNNRLVIQKDGSWVLYKDDGVTVAATGTFAKDAEQTERSGPAWQ